MEAPVTRPIASLPGVQLAWMEIAKVPDPALLTEKERAIFETFTVEKRRAEWWSGRITARAALEAAGVRGVSILADERGVPRLEGAGAAGAHVSISHGKRIAAAVAVTAGAPYPSAGVDIVDREDDARIRRIAYRVLTPEEKTMIEDEPLGAMLAWGTREAIAKATSTGMFMFALSGAPMAGVDRVEGRVLTRLEGIEVIFEVMDGGDVLVLAGATAEAALRARAASGIGTREF